MNHLENNQLYTFYLAFSIWNAVRTELSWTHYRLLSRVEDEQKRRFYLTQSLESGWNSRTSKYLLYLPKEEDLISLIEQDRERFALDFDDAETSDES